MTTFRSTSSLLFDENPLIILPQLAVRIGLNEAIVIQQVHYWLRNKAKGVKEKDLENEYTYKEGKFWTFNSYVEWQEQFPWWGVKTVQRTFNALEKQGILIAKNFNKMKADNTKWYTIDYDALDAYAKPKRKSKHDSQPHEEIGNIDTEPLVKLTKCAVEPLVNLTKPPSQLDQATWSTCPSHEVNLTKPIPETSSETSSKITSETSFGSSSSSSFTVGEEMKEQKMVEEEEEKLEVDMLFLKALGNEIKEQGIMPSDKQINATLNEMIKRGIIEFTMRDIHNAIDLYRTQCAKRAIGQPSIFFVNGFEMELNKRYTAELGVAYAKECEAKRIEQSKNKVPFYNWLEERD